MAEKNLDFGKFREARISEPDDLSLLRFIFKKYLKDKTMMKKLMDESEKNDQSDMAYMLAESLALDRKSTRLNSSHSSISYILFFFLMTRPPPRSPLFPYTTLFRS